MSIADMKPHCRHRMVGKMLSSSVSKAALLLELPMVSGVGLTAASTLQVVKLEVCHLGLAEVPTIRTSVVLGSHLLISVYGCRA